jgi:serine O-acetyltransferase
MSSAETEHPAEISAQAPDWSRESFAWGRWDPPKRLLRSIRYYQSLCARQGGLSYLLMPLAVIRHRFWSAVTGTDIPLNCRLGGGLLIPHPNGIVIHPGAEIGPNCLIFQQVTLGYGGPQDGLPKIGGHVDIGAGAKILGGVTIGNHAKIGANAVVLHDVPERGVAVGIPARIQPARSNK